MIIYKKLKIGKGCLCSCSFCSETSEDFLSPQELDSFLNQPRISESVMIYGGEPLLWSPLPDFVADLRRRGVRRVKIKTTAIPLADFHLAFNLVSKGAHHFEVEFFSSNPSTFQLMTGKAEALNLSIQGISNLRRLSLENGQTPFLSFRLMVNSLNLEEISETLSYLLSFKPDRFVIFLVPPLKSLNSLMAQLKKAAEIARLNLIWLQVENIPFCLLGDLSYHYGGLLNTSEGFQKKTDQCQKCAANPICLGIPPFYQEIEGFSLKPFLLGESQAEDFKFLAREKAAL